MYIYIYIIKNSLFHFSLFHFLVFCFFYMAHPISGRGASRRAGGGTGRRIGRRDWPGDRRMEKGRLAKDGDRGGLAEGFAEGLAG